MPKDGGVSRRGESEDGRIKEMRGETGANVRPEDVDPCRKRDQCALQRQVLMI